MKRFGMLRLVFLSVILLFGCSAGSSGPCPEDRELIDRFHAGKAQFAALKNDPENSGLREKMGIRDVHIRSNDPLRIWFTVWFKDFAGPGGVAKGYAFCVEPPKGLVESIDKHSRPGSAEHKMLYRHMEGPWHLYYRSDN